MDTLSEVKVSHSVVFCMNLSTIAKTESYLCIRQAFVMSTLIRLLQVS